MRLTKSVLAAVALAAPGLGILGTAAVTADARAADYRDNYISISTSANDRSPTPSVGPPAETAYPSTLMKVLSNLLYVAQHDLAIQGNFYRRKTLERLFGATGFGGLPPPAGEVMLLFSILAVPNREATHGASVLLRRQYHEKDRTTVTSLSIQISGSVTRPTYDDVAVLVEDRWKKADMSHVTVPIGKYVPSYVPHGDANMNLIVQTHNAKAVLEFYFDNEARLANVLVFITPFPTR